MDNRTIVINNTLMKMQSKLTADQLRDLRDTLYIELDKYEVTDRSTAVVPLDDSPNALLKRYIATKRIEGISETSLEQYTLRCSMMIETIGKPLDKITVYDLRYYLATYKETRKVSNRTLENIRMCLKGFFTWLYIERLIPSNPTESLDPIRYEKQVRLPYSAAEMERLRRSCTNKRDRAIVEFLYATGCRVSEIVSLDRSDIDWQRKQAIVTGKGNKQRTIYIDDVAILYLSEYLESRHDTDPCLFAAQRSTDGHRRLTISGVENMLKQLGKRANVDDVHPHRFRRTMASQMIARGAAIQDVATILGHEDIATTQIYCYIDKSSVQSAYQRCIA